MPKSLVPKIETAETVTKSQPTQDVFPEIDFFPKIDKLNQVSSKLHREVLYIHYIPMVFGLISEYFIFSEFITSQIWFFV